MSKQAAEQKRQTRQPQVAVRVTIGGVTYETQIDGRLVEMGGK